jgi:hypothetical protein
MGWLCSVVVVCSARLGVRLVGGESVWNQRLIEEDATDLHVHTKVILRTIRDRPRKACERKQGQGLPEYSPCTCTTAIDSGRSAKI